MQRLTDPYAENGGHSPVMNPHYTDNRTPSPGRPLQPYQHETEFQPLQMPSTDHLLDQPTVRLTHVVNQSVANNINLVLGRRNPQLVRSQRTFRGTSYTELSPRIYIAPWRSSRRVLQPTLWTNRHPTWWLWSIKLPPSRRSSSHPTSR